MKFEEKIRKFMYGRYGPDELYKFLFELYIVLIIINLFIRSNILNFISLLVIISSNMVINPFVVLLQLHCIGLTMFFQYIIKNL